MKYVIPILLAISLCACAAQGSSDRIPIDQVPMYGSMNRNSIPELKKGDAEFISNVTEHYGTREAAAIVWVEQAFRYYEADNLKKAMQRYNQAWLLDPNNPDVYWGFSAVLWDRRDLCGAMEMCQKAESVGVDSMILPNRATFLVDFAIITSLCALNKDPQYPDTDALIQRSDEMFMESESIWPSAYLYDKWWQALYWRGEYLAAWQKVAMMRQKGEEPDVGFLNELREKMSEPEK